MRLQRASKVIEYLLVCIRRKEGSAQFALRLFGVSDRLGYPVLGRGNRRELGLVRQNIGCHP
jgi:hypothetical protein